MCKEAFNQNLSTKGPLAHKHMSYDFLKILNLDQKVCLKSAYAMLK